MKTVNDPLSAWPSYHWYAASCFGNSTYHVVVSDRRLGVYPLAVGLRAAELAQEPCSTQRQDYWIGFKDRRRRCAIHTLSSICL